MNKLNFNSLKSKIIEAYNRRKFFYVLTIIFVSCFLAIGGVLLGYSGYMLPIDNIVEDKLYQGQNTSTDQIVLIEVDNTSNCLYQKASYNTEELLEFINTLNQNSSQPYVIGVQGKLSNTSYSLFSRYLDSLDNVVFGELLSNNYDGSVFANTYEGLLSLYDNNENTDNIERFVKTGYTNIYEDSDGVVRHYLLDNKESYVSFAEQIYNLYLKKTNTEIKNVNKETNGFSIINYANNKEYFQTYSYDDVNNDNFDLSVFKDKIVLIGFADNYLDELYITPNNKNEYHSNIDIQANTILSLINGNMVKSLNSAAQLSYLWLISSIYIFIVLTCTYTTSVIVGVILLVANSLLCDLFHSQFNLLMHPLYYIVAIVFILICGAFITINKSTKLQFRRNAILNQYMDSSIKKRILNRAANIKDTSVVKHNVAVMFVDIRNFSKIINELKSNEVTNILNTYFDVIDANVQNNNGNLNKFIGDGALVFWDDDECNGEACYYACKCAIDISKGIMQVDDYIYHRYQKELSFGIGINFGEAIIGDFGSSNRRDFTLVGEVVSIANRLERFATSGNIYISQIVKDTLGNRIDATPLPTKVIFKNEYIPVTIYSLSSINEGAIKVIDNRKEIIHSTYNDYVLYFLGTRGSYNVSGKRFNEFGGLTTCMILKTNKHAVIYDCGTGLGEAHDILADCTKIDIILSHVHYDHCLGLLDWSVIPKNAKLNFYGNFRAWLGLRTINQLFSAPFWPADTTIGDMNQIPEWGKMLYLGDDITIRFYPSNHPNGAILSHTYANGKNMVVMVDCESANAIPFDVVNHADLVVYDGMYDNSEYGNKIGWGHSTWQEGCELAQRAEVKQLIITHHSPHKSDSELFLLEKQAKNLYPSTVFARANMVIKL